MSETLSQEKEPRKPSSEEVSDYARKLGLRLRDEFEVLKEFGVFGKKAKNEGWFVAYRALAQAAVALKLADLIGLDSGDRRILAESATLDMFYKRKETEAKSRGLSSAELDTLHQKGIDELRKMGSVNEDVVRILEETTPDFYWSVGVESYKPQDEHSANIYRLEKLLAYAHNCTKQVVDVEGSRKAQHLDIVNWKERLEDAKEKYPQLMQEKRVVRGKEYAAIELEEMSMKKIEEEILEAIRLTHPEIDVQKVAKNLPAYIKQAILQDIVDEKEITL